MTNRLFQCFYKKSSTTFCNYWNSLTSGLVFMPIKVNEQALTDSWEIGVGLKETQESLSVRFDFQIEPIEHRAEPGFVSSVPDELPLKWRLREMDV